MSGEMIDVGICPECHEHCEAEYPEDEETETKQDSYEHKRSCQSVSHHCPRVGRET